MQSKLVLFNLLHKSSIGVENDYNYICPQHHRLDNIDCGGVSCAECETIDMEDIIKCNESRGELIEII